VPYWRPKERETLTTCWKRKSLRRASCSHTSKGAPAPVVPLLRITARLSSGLSRSQVRPGLASGGTKQFRAWRWQSCRHSTPESVEEPVLCVLRKTREELETSCRERCTSAVPAVSAVTTAAVQRCAQRWRTQESPRRLVVSGFPSQYRRQRTAATALSTTASLPRESLRTPGIPLITPGILVVFSTNGCLKLQATTRPPPAAIQLCGCITNLSFL
ncbi:hypothetical protein B484DRAFT_281843, partial [Ochromonadaceae sp. CCMP2298]